MTGLAGSMGESAATDVAIRMRSSFPNLHVGLLVGIGGGVPLNEDMHLGDVVISKPKGTTGGVVQAYRGAKKDDGTFEPRGHLNSPPKSLLSAAQTLDSNIRCRCDDLMENISRLKSFAGEKDRYRFPREAPDRLYRTSILHKSGEHTNCSNCDPTGIKRQGFREPPPKVFQGIIASSDILMKDGAERDRIVEGLGGDILCFEMEAAGVMNTLHCLVIRAAQKALKRQEIKEFLVPSKDCWDRPSVPVVPSREPSDPVGLFEDWCWFVDESFRTWQQGRFPAELRCIGDPGIGKVTQFVKAAVSGMNAPVLSLRLDIQRDRIRSVEQCLCILIRQLLEHTHTFEPSEELAELLEEGCRTRTVERSVCKRALKAELGKFQNAFAIVDGLDEIDLGISSSLQDDLSQIREELSENNMRLAIFSRFNDEESGVDPRNPVICAAASSDCEGSNSHQMKFHIRLQAVRIPDSVIHNFIERGIAKLDLSEAKRNAADGLPELMAQRAQAAHIQEMREDTPNSIQDAYFSIIGRLPQPPSPEAITARKSLTLTAFAYRDLTVAELADAIALRTRGTSPLYVGDGLKTTQRTALTHHPSRRPDPSSIILSTCGLIGKGPEEDARQCRWNMHRTLRECMQSLASNKSVNESDSAATLWIRDWERTSVIEMLEFLNHVLDRLCSSLESTLTHYPYFGYAAVHWPEHVRHFQTDSKVEEHLEKFLKRRRRIDAWVKTASALNQWDAEDIPREVGVSAFQICACYDFHSVVSKLGELRSEVNSQDSKFHRTPLVQACRQDSEKTALALIRLGASFALADGDGYTPLIASTLHGQVKIIEAILGRLDEDDEAILHINRRLPAESNQNALLLSLTRYAAFAEVFKDYNDYNEGIQEVITEHSYGLNDGNVSSSDEYLDVDLENVIHGDQTTADGADAEDYDEEPTDYQTKIGFLRILCLLINDSRVEVDAIDDNGHSAMNLAATLGSTDIMKLLLNRSKKGFKQPNINSPDRDGYTPLINAARLGNTSVVRLLIAKGANPSLRDNHGGGNFLQHAIDHNHYEIIMIMHGKIANEYYRALDNCGRTLLHAASINNRVEIAIFLLDKVGLDVNAQGQNGETALHDACRVGNANMIDILLQHKACPTICETSAPHRTAADVAWQNGYLGLLPQSLAMEIMYPSVHKANSDFGMSSDEDNQSASQFSTLPDQVDDPEELVLEHAHDVETTPHETPDTFNTLRGWPDYPHKSELPIWSLARFGAYNLIQRRFRKRKYSSDDSPLQNAFVNVPDPDTANTPVHWAAQLGHIKTLEILLSAGYASNAQNLTQRTALHLAAGFGRQRCTRLLIGRCADPNVRDMCGDTPLDMALKLGHRDTALALMLGGARLNELSPSLRNKALVVACVQNHVDAVRSVCEAGASPWTSNEHGVSLRLMARERDDKAIFQVLEEYS
ncbi:MAG: hypothetical protein Q9162_006700 [Coniocarpon cinnabarinum]